MAAFIFFKKDRQLLAKRSLECFYVNVFDHWLGAQLLDLDHAGSLALSFSFQFSF